MSTAGTPPESGRRDTRLLLVVKRGDGTSRDFRIKAHYYAPDLAWFTMTNCQWRFMVEVAGGTTLSVHTASGQNVLDFPTAAAEKKALEMMGKLCWRVNAPRQPTISLKDCAPQIITTVLLRQK
jgi:hypothetical protein